MQFVMTTQADTPSRYPLSTVPAGTTVRVVKITGGVRMLHSLAKRDIMIGAEMTVIRNDWGPLLVAVAAQRVGLGRELAYHVLVALHDAP